MNRILFTEAQESYKVALLIKPKYFNKSNLLEYYVNPLLEKGLQYSDIVAFELDYTLDKVTAKQAKQYLVKLLPVLKKLGVEYLLCADSTYFKALTKQTKADNHIGYILNCALKDYDFMQIVYTLNYGSLFHNPNQYPKIDLSLQALVNSISNTYKEIGTDIIHDEYYPQDLQQIEKSLNKLLQFPVLTCDIETYSLTLRDAHIATIAFATSKHTGLAISCDIEPTVDNNRYFEFKKNQQVRNLLKKFFEKYTGKLIFHNASYDVKVIIYTLFMKHPLDRVGMLYGLETMTRKLHDTKVIAYLALNSTARVSYSLKDLAHEFAGNYALTDINDIRYVALDKLKRYNLIDCLSTYYVYEKYYPKMCTDNQEHLYNTLMLPSLKVIIQMELVGMPLERSRVEQVKQTLTQESSTHISNILNHPKVKEVEYLLKQKELDKVNAKLKTKQKTLDDISLKFNPNSSQHLIELIYHHLGLPVLDTTQSKAPATGAKSLEKLLNHTEDESIQYLLKEIISLGQYTKILDNFIPAFEQAWNKADGRSYLHGSFNLGGTISGRLSSSKPNLQNLPSGSRFGKLIKECFSAPKGYLFVGADFSSLEDRINALLTKDDNKLKVYTEGFDGHSLRAYYYWKDKMPDIKDTVEGINSIQSKYKDLRQKSKAPTFALTYNGTYSTLMKNCGFSEQEAKQIETNYHKMYAQSAQWSKEKINQCAKQGYIDVAFGLRIRTPLLKQTLLGTCSTPKEAEAEARSVGNAISGQSYGLLNNRAIVAFMNKVWNSPYKYDIIPVSLIHDAIYLIIKEDIKVLHWVNENLIKEMQWQNLDEIKHDTVKLGAELDVYYPNWSNAITLSNNMNQKEILELCRKEYAEYKSHLT